MSYPQVYFDTLNYHARINLMDDEPMTMLLKGPPGTMKSAWAENVLPEIIADVKGISVDDIHYEEFRVVGRDSVEFAGYAIPVKNEDNMVTRYTIPPLKVALDEVCSKYKYVIVNFDELFQGDRQMWCVLSDVLNAEKKSISGWDLPNNFCSIGTGNRAEDKSEGKRSPAHMTDRCYVAEIMRDIDFWEKSFAAENVHPVILGCAKANPNNGFFADSVPAKDENFCTLRSLTYAGKKFEAFLQVEDFDGTIPPNMRSMFEAIIGFDSTNILCGYIEQHDRVPTAEQIMADPDTALVPEETPFQSVAGNIAVGAAVDAETGEKAIHYLTRLRPDLQVTLATNLLQRSVRHGWRIGGPVAQQFIEKFHDLIPLAESANWK